MNHVQVVALSAAVAVASTALYSGWFWALVWLAGHLLVAALGFYYTVQWNLVCGKNYKPASSMKQKSIVNTIIKKMMELECSRMEPPKKVVISRNLDNAIREVIDLVCQHYLLSWYQPFTDDKTFIKHAQSEMWSIIDRISQRLSEVDLVRFLSEDVLNCLHQHFKNVRLAKRDLSSDKSDGQCVKFELHYWLRDEESELACLRKLCDALLLTLVSKEYSSCAPIRHLLREILAGSVLNPTIELICDPDYINLKLLDYVAYREKLYADTKRTYMYSASYEGFVKMIKSTDSVNDLRQMRFNIISEILQASAINNLKKQQGLTTDKDVAPKGTNKGELLKARNLERYKNQLTVAKQLCEKRILGLGGTIYEGRDASITDEDIPGQKVFSFAVIMEMSQGREFFMKFLKKEGVDSYLGFWNAVEKLKTTVKDQRHHVASEMYQQYITSPSSLVKVDKAVLKGMEEFLRGDKGPEAFFAAQKDVQKLLEDQYYPSFIVSDTYFLMAASLTESVPSDEESITSDELFLDLNEHFDDGEENLITGQSYHAQQQLRALDSKITNKARALLAQRTSQKTEGNTKLKKVHEDMEQELENLKHERRSLEMHIARTQKWIDNIGQWNAHVYDASIVVDDDRKVPQFVLLVSLSAEGSTSPEKPACSTEGWAISRTLEDFHALQEKLSQISSWLQKKELPSTSKIFKSLDDMFIQKAKVTLDDYLECVMKDERVVHSEALYAFLSPTPEFVYQHTTAAEKKSKFSLASLIKSLPNIRSDHQENEDDFMFGGDESSREERSADSIAKPLYQLVGEVFELQGVFRWFRRSLMSFVELTFGRSIDRQLKATVDWLVSEQMLIFYTQTFKESMWPGGEWVESAPARPDHQKQEDRIKAKTKLLENMPDTLRTLVGEDNGRRGLIKIFEVLQIKSLNKHLLYNLLEIFLQELLPEMKTAKENLQAQFRDQQLEHETNL